ncbi:hypothetical protein [Crassaminicella indica]|uniref:Uncharacterized protein n=1 Tax=Crassaminicella indica TaxID=2855394 RepID=A0ABX8R8W9_9CLOT|nr:hypothetical protein [Crassaminicella indica]QXM05472.1 hypothetical protein KVH43_08760 [Crassaminicella indica]
MKKYILEKISNTLLSKIFHIASFEAVDWIWVNKEIFKDLLYNLDLDKEFDEKILDSFLEAVDDKEIINALINPFQKEGYTPINQWLFANFEKGYKITEDIETIIFVKEKYYRKLLIRAMHQYSWILKAMAIDTYKMRIDDKSLKEIYEELYDENTRIVEEILSKGQYEFLIGVWKFIQDTKELYFYKAGKFFNSWSQGEVDAKFEELILK